MGVSLSGWHRLLKRGRIRFAKCVYLLVIICFWGCAEAGDVFGNSALGDGIVVGRENSAGFD